ncbi:hypothetical protein SPBR_03479 [Sporothrix brasiliensis 5110]|uniref:Transcription factor domain-containing protein n=1 Tax=Sporothrix brasiliensis 5110 TaxID=1398154 RepID=A0A0C2JE26_9PEZI|nr:uncharacterized protein SPBR_03479 [Sporothrix brasiliensis 5110]KIH95182.1 hypothetical protein SPBR_03479 [Sporothrix brasiliensis 5110]
MTIPFLNIKISLDEFCPPAAFAAVMVDFFDEIYPVMPLVQHANEAVLMFRELGLYRAEAYKCLSRAGAIISRRMFWVLYMMQMYSYTSAPEPLTVLHFDASKTDWDALRTNDMDYVGIEPDPDDKDEDIDEAADVDKSKPPEPGTYSRRHRHKHTLIMAGFNAIIAMHICVTEMIVDRLPRPPPFAPALSYSRPTSTALPSFSALSTFSTPSPYEDQHFVAPLNYSDPSQPPRLPPISLSVRSSAASTTAAAAPSPSSTVTTTLQMIQSGITRIRHVLDGLPPEFRFPHALDMPSDDCENPSPPDPYRAMRANIHLTGIFLQSLVVESYVAKMLHTRHAPRTWTTSGHAENSPAASADKTDICEAHLRWNDRFEIWKLREGIAKELQNLLQSFPMSVFEVTGVAMTVKIRRVAATLLEHSDPTAPPEEAGEAERRRQGYLDYFVRVLTELDHSPTASFGFVKSRS